MAIESDSDKPVERRLSAILAADVAGYSRLMGDDEEGTLARLKAHRRELIEPTVALHYGRFVKLTGDGALVEFPSVVQAVRCALRVQQGMIARNADVAPEKRIEFRIGINLGDVMVEDGDIYGDGVNIAARLEALADPGGICISDSVHEQIRGKLAVAVTSLGEQKVKNMAEPIRPYRIIGFRSVYIRQRRATSGRTPLLRRCAAQSCAIQVRNISRARVDGTDSAVRRVCNVGRRVGVAAGAELPSTPRW